MIRINFSNEEIEKLRRGRFEHVDKQVRFKMETLYLKSQQLPHDLICRIMCISKTTLVKYLDEYLNGGIENLHGKNIHSVQSELEKYKDEIEKEFRKNPPPTINEACDRIEKLTGIKRKTTQIRRFLKSIGMRILKVGMIPAKADPDEQKIFKQDKLDPVLEEAKSGRINVFFVDASHFVHGAFLGFVWCFERVFVKAPSGRKRFNVLGALNAVTHQLITVTNDSYINALSVCELLRTIARQVTNCMPITLVLDNARYQKCGIVTEVAESLNIELLYLPSYSPNLNLIERFWKFVKKECLYSKYYEKFAQFRKAIENCISSDFISDKYETLKNLLTLNFQTFEKVQFQAA
jgi:transposase